MKKLILALTVSTFALAGSLHAADTKPVAVKDKGACCDMAASADKAKASTSCCKGKSACSKMISRRIAMSPRAAELAAR